LSTSGTAAFHSHTVANQNQHTFGGGGCLEHTRPGDRLDFTHGTEMWFQGQAPQSPRHTGKLLFSSTGTVARCKEKMQVSQWGTLPGVALLWCQAIGPGIARLVMDSERNAEAALMHPEVCKTPTGHGSAGQGAAVTAMSTPSLRVLGVPQGAVPSHALLLDVLRPGETPLLQSLPTARTQGERMQGERHMRTAGKETFAGLRVPSS